MMTTELTADLLEDLRLPSDYQNPSLDSLAAGESRWLRDVRINLSTALRAEHLSEKETALLGLALAANAKNRILLQLFKDKASEQGASEAEQADAIACASLLAANNVLYRFRHFAEKEVYEQQPARIKMNLMMNPVLGKEFFELVSLAVSAVNGCERCVKAHEQSLLDMGSSEARIFDAVRLASIINSLDRILF
jgi:alkyl hydroperoxide reductase subunit D